MTTVKLAMCIAHLQVLRIFYRPYRYCLIGVCHEIYEHHFSQIRPLTNMFSKKVSISLKYYIFFKFCMSLWLFLKGHQVKQINYENRESDKATLCSKSSKRQNGFKGIVSRDFGGLQMILMDRIGVPDVLLKVYSFFNFRFHIVI